MTGYLLDTNVISEMRKRHRGDHRVAAWFRAREGDELWLSALVVGELRRGALLIARRDRVAGESLHAWLRSVVDDFGDRILPITTAIAERWARISLPDPMPVVDGLLAATAIEHGLTFATRNVADIERTSVAWVNPFAAV